MTRLRPRRLLLAAALFTALTLPAGEALGAPARAPQPRVVSVAVGSVAAASGRTAPDPWLGFGINWDGVPYKKVNGTVVAGIHGLGDPFRWDALSWSQDLRQLQVDESRLLELHPAFVRMMWAADWFDPSAKVGAYDFATTAMRDTYADLAFLYRHHIPVLASMFAPPRWYMPYGSPKWTAVQTALATQLVQRWHFSNVRAFMPINEPTQEQCGDRTCPIRFATWRAATAQLKAAFAARGLGDLGLLGPSVSSPPPWSTWGRSVANWPRRLAASGAVADLEAVDWHEYIWTNPRGKNLSGQAALHAVQRTPVVAYTARIVAGVRSRPSTARAPTLVSEFGFAGISSSRRQGVPTFDYALALLTFGMALARSGVGGAAVWELDPDIPRFAVASDGLWRSGPPYTPYPVEQSVDLLMRAAPPGAIVQPVRAPSGGGLHLLATSTPGSGWALLVVNDAATPTTVHLEGLPHSGSFHEIAFTKGAGSFATTPRPVPVDPSDAAAPRLGPRSALLLTAP